MSDQPSWDGPPDEAESIYDVLGTDKTMEQQGVLLDFGRAGRFKIARAGGGNQAYNEVRARRFRPFSKQQRQGTLSEEVAQKALVEVYAEAVVKGWEGVLGPDRQPIPFSIANAIKLMTDIPQLFEEIRVAATDYANYQSVEAQEAAGN